MLPRQGGVALLSLPGLGFGYQLREIKRELPEPTAVFRLKKPAFRPEGARNTDRFALGPHSGDGGVLPRSGTKDAATEMELDRNTMP